MAEPHARGGLNLYSNQPHQIDGERGKLGAMFARLAAVALGWGREDETLKAALDTRNLIVQAVIERYRLDPDRVKQGRVAAYGDVPQNCRQVLDDLGAHCCHGQLVTRS